MQLAEALFEQITSTLRGGAAGPHHAPVAPDAQRRREPRVGVGGQVTIIPLGDGLRSASFDVPLRDLSAGGVGFAHTGRMRLDEQFVVLLPEGRGAVAVLCEVAHYQPLDDHWYAVGARFVRVLRQPSAADRSDALPLSARPAVPRRAAS